ncbi:hypothetical protein ITR00_09280 [Pediococcus pentosaceus]|uniref:PenO n=1 Tax=Pediococcus pentosaceus TaxID=1255 RepID=Q9WVX3_PEDPE|nr:hypothetical protein [Pediococcus pentosaceus]AAD25901.1 PenO [Pediococcus pentosaceus]AAD39625.1 unknown [Pediococcus pentosaceus]MBF7126198.1 hypothetical protein [Pediococcus pentosaceus]WPK17605.1 hypothetical protein R6U75_09910 [Pediococcus pentosaceus]
MESALNGRNESQSNHINGTKVIEKRLNGETKDKERRMNNMKVFDSLLNEKLQIKSPRLVHINEDKFVVSHEWVENATTLEDLLQNDLKRFIDLIPNAMKYLAEINNLPTSINESKNSVVIDNTLSPLVAISEYAYTECTGAELELFSILQHDSDLLKGLITKNQKVVAGVRHGDMRLDQFLVTDLNVLIIVDFEEFGVGDSLTDLAGFLGSILFNTLLDVFSKASMDASSEEDVNRMFMEKGEKKLMEIKPLFQQAISKYSKYNHGSIDFSVLSADIGWFILERIISRSKFTFRLSSVDKAIAGVGRQAIVNPDSLSTFY